MNGIYRYYRAPHGLVYRTKSTAVPDPSAAVIDPSEGSEDMKRLLGLVSEEHVSKAGSVGGAWKRALVRFANGESAARPVVTFQPGKRVRSKGTRYVYTIGRNGYYDHHRDEVFSPATLFTSEHYEPVEDYELEEDCEPGESAKPPAVTFKPGQVVRDKGAGCIFTVAKNGYYCHDTGRVTRMNFLFTSEEYELVEGSDD